MSIQKPLKRFRAIVRSCFLAKPQGFFVGIVHSLLGPSPDSVPHSELWVWRHIQVQTSTKYWSPLVIANILFLQWLWEMPFWHHFLSTCSYTVRFTLGPDAFLVLASFISHVGHLFNWCPATARHCMMPAKESSWGTTSVSVESQLHGLNDTHMYIHIYIYIPICVYICTYIHIYIYI